MLARLAAAAALLPLCAAQCTLPATLPVDTAFAAGNPAECVLGGGLDGAGEGPCVIECVAGQAQAAGGYDYVCTGADMPDPTPACAPCPADTYGETPGLAVCEGCTANAGTDGATGAVAVTACLCDAGYDGELAVAADTCEECALGTYTGEVGPGPCTPCPDDAITEATGSTVVTACLCNVGFTGDIAAPEDTCTGCEVATYKDETGPGACVPCPADSTTEEEASTAVTACLCEAGFTGDIAAPADECASCDIDFWKTELGPAACTACPENSNTEAAGSPSFTACVCDTANGWEGEIGSPEEVCRQPTSVGPVAVVGISAAAVVGVAAALGGVFYGKGAYSVQSNADLGIERRAGDTRNDPLLDGQSRA